MKDLKGRTKRFALDVIRFCADLPKQQVLWIIGKQLIRSACSVGANYRSSCRAKSKADFIAKLSIVEEETDESMYWLELLKELEQGEKENFKKLYNEANEIIAIIVKSKKTARERD